MAARIDPRARARALQRLAEFVQPDDPAASLRRAVDTWAGRVAHVTRGDDEDAWLLYREGRWEEAAADEVAERVPHEVARELAHVLELGDAAGVA